MDKLEIYFDHYYRIHWVFPGDEYDTGATLGEDKYIDTPPKEEEDWDHWMANKVCHDAGIERDPYGYRWESQSAARVALRAIRLALKEKRPIQEWERKALAAGWKPPLTYKRQERKRQ
jgi:hypothetical protein